MSLTTEEKGLIAEALQLYIQVASQQVPPQHAQQIATIAKGIIRKLDTLGASKGPGGNKPNGITDEWFKNVCETCDKLTAAGCSDKVTEKYPGKCDPILKFEREKFLATKKQ